MTTEYDEAIRESLALVKKDADQNQTETVTYGLFLSMCFGLIMVLVVVAMAVLVSWLTATVVTGLAIGWYMRWIFRRIYRRGYGSGYHVAQIERFVGNPYYHETLKRVRERKDV